MIDDTTIKKHEAALKSASRDFSVSLLLLSIANEYFESAVDTIQRDGLRLEYRMKYAFNNAQKYFDMTCRIFNEMMSKADYDNFSDDYMKYSEKIHEMIGK